jgi:hypothetical protein
VLDVSFACLGARPATWAAAPTMLLDLQVREGSGRRVYGMGLHCQIRAEPARRRYTASEQDGLLDLFGEPSRWGDTLKPIQVTTVSTMVPGFTGSTAVELPVPCTYDTEVAAAKYFRALDGGDIPLLLLFSGTVFFAGGDGLLVEQVPWDNEVAFRLPVSAWRELMDAHFPGVGWLRLQTEVLDALARYRRTRMLPSWEDTVETLLKEAGAAP